MKRLNLLVVMLICSIAMTRATVLGEIGQPFDPTTMANGESKQCLAYFAGCAPGKAALGYAYGGDNNIGTPQTGQDISSYVYTITRSADGTYFEVKDVNGSYWAVFPNTATGNYSNGTPTSSTSYKGDLTLTAATSYDNAIATGNATYVYNISSKTNTTGFIYHDGTRMRANTDSDKATAPAAIQFVRFSEYEAPTTFFGQWIIKVDDTHYAKSAAKNTQWSTEISSQTEWDIFDITGPNNACTISLNGRTNNIGHDGSMKMFTDKTANTKYTIVDAGNGKVKIKNDGYWVYVDNGTFTWNTAKYTELTLTPVPYYCYMISRATERYEYQYNNALMAANTNHLTLESDTKVTTNNGVWKITQNGNSWTVVNGDGLPIKASLANGTIQGPYPTIHPTHVSGTDYYYFSEKLDCSPNDNFAVGGIRFMTTWDAGDGATASDLQWKFEQIDLTGKEIYDVKISGADNAYITLKANPAQYAYNGGFFVLDSKPAASDFAVAGVPDGKTGFIVMTGNEIQVTVGDRVDLFNTSNGDGIVPTYRIPGIVATSDGRLIATASRQVCGTDPGFGRVDVVCRLSEDNGSTWSDIIPVAVGDDSLISPQGTPLEAAYGDAAVVADRTSNEVLIMAVGGCTVYSNGTTTRQNPNRVAYIHSSDGGRTWETPVEKTEQIYSLFDGGNNVMQSGFIGSGKLFQSRIVKVGKYYRLYAALCARPNGNRVIYSDDFGVTWYALGGSEAQPVPGGDEPKCEEFPDGRVIVSSRSGSGRLYNVYTYTNTTTAEGYWGAVTKSTFDGAGHAASGNPTNGELLILPVKRNSDSKDMYLALQTIPTGSGRDHVGVYYKELTDMTDMNTVGNFAIDWNGYYVFSDNTGAYSSLDLMNDNRIAVIMEDTYTYFRKEPNPLSTSFPTEPTGEHNYDGYDNLFLPLTLETITSNEYSVNTDVNRGEFVKFYLGAVVDNATISSTKRASAKALVAELGDNPTTDQIDAIYVILNSGFEVEEGKVYTLMSNRMSRYVTSTDVGSTLDGTTSINAEQYSYWYFQKRTDGKYNIVNYKHNGMINADNVSSGSALNVTAAEPAKGWEVKKSSTAGWYIIVGDGIQFNQQNNGSFKVLNWGNGTNLTDNGCMYNIAEVQEALIQPGSTQEAPVIIGNVTSVTDVTDNIQAGATSIDLTQAKTVSAAIDNDFVQSIAQKTQNANTLVFAAAGNEITADNNVVVKSGETYTCHNLKLTDGYAFASPVEFTAENAQYTRNMPSYKWGTLCLPYDIVQNHDGTDYDLYRIKESSGNTLVLQRYEDGVIPAGTPVIVYRNSEATGIDMSNTGTIQVTNATQGGQMQLVGCLQPTDISQGYYIANDAFWSASAIGGVTVPAFRAYIETQSDARKLNITIGTDPDATGIEAIDAMNTQGSVSYDLNGRKTDDIMRGINIIRTSNGKTYKVIIK
ncbi:MAG: exo-alpha-sialidase [Bacteroidaceae bacterium]|nr:exo-alpha-sialidase [Bacteroidaceae bacterium]